MTWNDLVRKYFPNASDEECEYILWEQTAFPCTNVEVIEKQIVKYKNSKS